MTRFAPVGDSALLVEFAADFSDAAHDQVVALDQAIGRAMAAGGLDGIVETVPAFVSLLVVFDPLTTDHDAVHAAVDRLDLRQAELDEPSRHRVPVCYDRSIATDLDAVAAAAATTTDGVVDAHLSGHYRVVMYGFAPGYAYLSGVPENINVPRKPQPVRDVPAGSVIIAGSQCLITTIAMPTGWSVIGRTRFRVLPEQPDETFAFRPGDHVVFEQISLDEFEAGS